MNNLKVNQLKYTYLMIITFLALVESSKAWIFNKSINSRNLEQLKINLTE